MRRSIRSSRRARPPWIALLSLGLASPVSAQLGPALAGRMAQAENAAVVNHNPAGLTRLPGW